MSVFSRIFAESNASKLNKISKALKECNNDMLKISKDFKEISLNNPKTLEELTQKISEIRAREFQIAERQFELRCQESELRGGADISGERLRSALK